MCAHCPAARGLTGCVLACPQFTAPEGRVLLPAKVSRCLNIEAGAVDVQQVSLPSASYAKLQPLTSDFLDIPNHKVALETALRGRYSLLIQGDIMPLLIGGRAYDVLVAELKPAQAVSIVNTECAVDIEPPLDGAVRSVQELALGVWTSGCVFALSPPSLFICDSAPLTPMPFTTQLRCTVRRRALPGLRATGGAGSPREPHFCEAEGTQCATTQRLCGSPRLPRWSAGTATSTSAMRMCPCRGQWIISGGASWRGRRGRWSSATGVAPAQRPSARCHPTSARCTLQ